MSPRLTRLYAALSATNEAILRTTSADALYQGVCDAAVHGGKFIAAALLLPDRRTREMELVAVTGRSKELLRRARISVDAATPEGRGLVGTAYRSRAPVVSANLQEDRRTGPWHMLARRMGAASGAAVPLLRKARVIGVLFFCSRDKKDFDRATIALLERLAENVAFALANFEHEAQRRRAGRRLRESEEKYRATLENIEDAYYEVDLHGTFVFANTAFPRLLGYAPHEIIGRNNRDVQTPAMAAVLEQALGEVYRTGIPRKSQDWEWLRRDGGRIHVEGSVHLVKNAAAAPIGFRGILRDVTARRKMEQRLRESEEKYRTILESIDDAYYEVDLKGNLVFWNTAFCRLIGRAHEEVQGLNNRAYQTPAVAGDVYRIFNRVYRSGAPTRSHVWTVIHKDGRIVWVEGSVQLIRDADAAPIGFRGTLRDVTARLEIERRLRESEARFRALTELSSDWYWEQDTQLRFTRVEGRRGNQEVVQRFLVGKCGWETGLEIDAEGGWEAHRALLRAHRPFRDTVMHWRGTKGGRNYISVSGEPVFSDAGEFLGYRGVTREITEQKRAQERVQYLATHDDLTGLPNRVMFSQLLAAALQTAQRYAHKFAILFIDLDRFKIINDTLGHEAGDVLLKEMSRRLKESLRTSDVVARLGGDEFVVLLQEIAEARQIAGVARKLLSAASRPMNIRGHECRITASIGICMHPDDGEDEQALMKNADSAMYLAKEEGKNTFQFYSRNIKTQSLERLAMEAGLRRAIERDEFRLHYQARLNLKTGTITGVEALIRWHNARLGPISPAQFIPLAEETGLIVALGRWVLKTACAQNAAWRQQGLTPVRMAVNLSTRQLGGPELLQDVRAALDQSGMPAEMLELEITESLVTQSNERAAELLAEIKRLGVRLAIDDFGTGYSSLAQLKRFPIDILKIDRSFIHEIPADAEDKAIVEAIIAMAKTLGLAVVAEGVETQAQAQFLRARGCDEMQGHYLSRPLDAEAFAEFLRSHARLAS